MATVFDQKGRRVREQAAEKKGPQLWDAAYAIAGRSLFWAHKHFQNELRPALLKTTFLRRRRCTTHLKILC